MVTYLPVPCHCLSSESISASEKIFAADSNDKILTWKFRISYVKLSSLLFLSNPSPCPYGSLLSIRLVLFHNCFSFLFLYFLFLLFLSFFLFFFLNFPHLVICFAYTSSFRSFNFFLYRFMTTLHHGQAKIFFHDAEKFLSNFCQFFRYLFDFFLFQISFNFSNLVRFTFSHFFYISFSFLSFYIFFLTFFFLFTFSS